MSLKIKTNKIFIVIAILIAVIVLASNGVFAAAEPGDLTPIGAALAIGIAGSAAAIGMGMAGSAAVGAITEKPEIFGKAFLFIVLIEAVAIYGLLVAILLVF
jgi:V/A-type H+-transporting ATPase subunit K